MVFVKNYHRVLHAHVISKIIIFQSFLLCSIFTVFTLTGRAKHLIAIFMSLLVLGR